MARTRAANDPSFFIITEKAPSKAFSWLKAATTAFKGGLTTRFDPPPNCLRELKLHRLSTNVCTKTKVFLKIFFDIRFRSYGA